VTTAALNATTARMTALLLIGIGGPSREAPTAETGGGCFCFVAAGWGSVHSCRVGFRDPNKRMP
jgi:hypothetical protein